METSHVTRFVDQKQGYEIDWTSSTDTVVIRNLANKQEQTIKLVQDQLPEKVFYNVNYSCANDALVHTVPCTIVQVLQEPAFTGWLTTIKPQSKDVVWPGIVARACETQAWWPTAQAN